MLVISHIPKVLDGMEVRAEWTSSGGETQTTAAHKCMWMDVCPLTFGHMTQICIFLIEMRNVLYHDLYPSYNILHIHKLYLIKYIYIYNTVIYYMTL